jgi:single-stranded-DNA-specific exonuclease
MEPFGAGNPEPRIVIENVKIIKPSVVGSGHVRCLLGADFGPSLKAIAFRCADTALGTALLNGRGERYNVAGTLRQNSWQGVDSVQFIIEDMMRLS